MNADWLTVPAAPLNDSAQRDAVSRQGILTKPPGALGRLEELAIRFAAMQGRSRPEIAKPHIVIFAADHGVAEEGVSAFPQSVTTEMIRNFARGGAAIAVLARELGASLEVINLGTVTDPGPLDGVLAAMLGPGTANFTRMPAMTADQLARAFGIGRQAAERAAMQGADLLVGGEMGIGNTTAATAIACALLDLPVDSLVGPGTGLDPAGIGRKADTIRRALARHREALREPLEILRCLGGFEIAALTGAYLASAQIGLPVLVDGFIASTAALLVVELCPQAAQWLVYSHGSAEPGHRFVLEALHAEPLLQLGMRLGEGSGAAAAVPLLRMACALHNGMATFAEAGVAEKNQP